jgi:hypothetical protein
MRRSANPSERFAPPGGALAGDFAPLFGQLSRPLDRGTMREGVQSLSRWLGSPHLRWRSGADR